VADATLQEEPIVDKPLRIPKLAMSAPPQGDSAAVEEAARLLVAAENPVIVAGRVARTPKGIELLVRLAEALQAPVKDQRLRMNFPSSHPLYADPGILPLTPSVRDADVILGLEVQDLYSMTHQMTPLNRFGMESRPTTKPGAKIVTISAVELNHKSNHQDFGRYIEADLSITGDAEATLPELIEAVTGRGAVEFVQALDRELHHAAFLLKAPPAEIENRVSALFLEGDGDRGHGWNQVLDIFRKTVTSLGDALSSRLALVRLDSAALLTYIHTCITGLRHQVRVRFAETDAMGIVHHSRYLPIMEEARVAYLREVGGQSLRNSVAEIILTGIS
jgi:hypothetical protein